MAWFLLYVQDVWKAEKVLVMEVFLAKGLGTLGFHHTLLFRMDASRSEYVRMWLCVKSFPDLERLVPAL